MQRAENKMEQGAASAEATAKDAANAAKGAMDDAAITAQVSAGLAKDPDLSAVKINVDTVHGKVTLNGPAPSTVARDRAETIAKGVSGVTSVSNQLVVTPG
jgi:osmotically-inducible protein OsmY